MSIRRTTRLVSFVCLGLLASEAITAENERLRPPPPLGVTRHDLAQATVVDAVVAGEVLHVALCRRADATAVLALVEPRDVPDVPVPQDEDRAHPDEHEDRPRTLLELPLDGGAPTTLAADLPKDVDTLSCLDLDGDGHDALLLGEPGTLWWMPAPAVGSGAPRVLHQGRGLELRAQPRRSAARPAWLPWPGAFPLALTEAGSLTRFAMDASGVPRPTDTTQLPVEASRTRSGLRLTTPPVTRLASADGRPIFAVGPQSFGNRRLRTVLIDPAATDEEERTREVWSLLPSPENVQDSWFVIQDGRPRLIVASTDGTKLSLFGRKRLRSFPLLADRSRAGKESSIKVELSSRIWQDVGLHVTDVDGDGKDDLVAMQYDGLGSGKTQVDVYLGKGTGRYQPKPRRTVIEGDLDHWQYGHDFDGDGEPDLLARGDGAIGLFPGVVRRHKKRAVAREAAWWLTLAVGEQERQATVSLGTGGADVDVVRPSLGRPRIADLDRDGDLDLVLASRSDRGRGRVRIYLLDTSAE